MLARGVAVIFTIAVAAVLLDGAFHAVMAQNPFGGPRAGGAEPQFGGIVGWL